MSTGIPWGAAYNPGVADDLAFRALADPTRRLLLDRLFEREGRPLNDLHSQVPGMTRFGVMKHLRILEAAGLVVTRKVGREKRHFLNPVPIRLIHDRWVSKYTAPMAAALVELKSALEADAMPPEHVQVYQIVIRTTPERLWQALTQSSFSRRYPFYMNVESTFELGAPIRFVDDTNRTAVE